MITNNYDANIVNIRRDTEGRILIIDLERHGTIYTIGNMYAPTRNFERDQQNVFNEFTHHLSHMKNEHTIIGGDFNLYMNPRLDKLDNMPEHHDNRNYREDIISYLEVNNLVDAWRTANPDIKFFTWHRGNKRSRLDYFFCSDHLLNFIENVSILPGVQSDHSLLKLTLKSGNDQIKWRGFWKFNSCLLHDNVYVNNIKSIIENTKSVHRDLVDKGAVWELVKLEIKNFTIPYCVQRKKQNEAHERELNNKFNRLHGIINSDSEVNEATINEFYQIKAQLEDIELERARGIILRSKTQWVEEGERNTSYFLRLEKQNFCNKLITKIKTEKEVITNPKDILEEGRKYYMKLYSDDDSQYVLGGQPVNLIEEEFLTNASLPKLNENQKSQCEGLMTESELLKSIKTFKNGKTPGTDGLTAEFYKFFWNDIKDLLLSSINFALQYGCLSTEQRRGIISLLPKKDKDRLYLKNWRPISLLNVDYKILAKALGNRIISFLPTLIDEDQTGYIKKRFIGNNIRIIEDILLYTNKNKVTGILLTIDFEKAFDSLKWGFLKKCLQAFNFGQRFVSYINVLYSDISAAVLNNGHISRWFYPEKGVRQGCPLSPYLFIMAVETLSCKIRDSKNVRGIQIDNCEIKITQLADDTTCFVKDKTSLCHLLDIFKQYQRCAGLKMNIDKTNAKTLGPEPMPPDDLYGLDWTEDAVNTLGVVLSGNETDHYILNYKKRLKTMKNLLSSWKCRYLSLKGKVTVINSLAISPLLYLASVIHVPCRVIQEVKQIVTDFIWNGKPPKIAYNVMIQNIENGGLKLVDFESKVKSLKVGFIKRLLQNKDGKWRATASHFFQTNNLNSYFMCNRSPCNIMDHKFYEETLQYWSELQEVKVPIAEIIYNQTIWDNRYITIQNRPFLWRLWQEKGIKQVYNIIRDDGEFLDHNEIKEIYDINCNFLNVLQIRQSLPLNWRQSIKNKALTTKIRVPFVIFCGKPTPLVTVATNILYNQFIKNKYVKPAGLQKWQSISPGLIPEEEWPDILKRPYRCLRETKLQSLQFKIIHRTINCNKKLFDMKLKETPMCSYCDETDDIPHFFVHCDNVSDIWKEFFIWWNQLGVFVVDFPTRNSEKDILFGLPNETDNQIILNFCILHMKNYIYKQRLFVNNNLVLEEFKRIILFKIEIEKRILIKQNKFSLYTKYHHLYENLKNPT